MNKNEFLTFCVANSVVIIIMYTILVIALIAYITTKLNKLVKTFNIVFNNIQSVCKEYNNELTEIDKRAFVIKRMNNETIESMKVFLAVLAKHRHEEIKISTQEIENVMTIKRDFPTAKIPVVNKLEEIDENTIQIEEPFIEKIPKIGSSKANSFTSFVHNSVDKVVDNFKIKKPDLCSMEEITYENDN